MRIVKKIIKEAKPIHRIENAKNILEVAPQSKN